MSQHTIQINWKRIILAVLALSLFQSPALWAAEWNVRSGGWCQLVEIPLPPLSVESGDSTGDDEGEFIPLFNGKNLDGWIIQGLEKAGPKIKEEGVLPLAGWDYWALVTKQDFKNFILCFDCKFDKKGNSGILIHTAKKEIYKSAFEIQLESGDDPKIIKPEHKSGAIYDHVAPLSNPAKPIGEWNSVEIKYVEPLLTVIINGVVVQDKVDLSKIPGLKHKYKKGSVSIQRNDYKKAVYFRNIRIRRLPD